MSMTRLSLRAAAASGVVALAAAVAVSGPVGANFDQVRRTPVVEAVEKAAPAVVNITTDSLTRQGMSRGTGSGVIVHPSGYVVTNSHVIRGAGRIYVSLCKRSGERPYQATLVEDDPTHDLALLRIARSSGAFPYVRLCATSEVMIGETAIAIGNPYGLGDTVTVGIISAMGRKAALPSGYTLRNLLQTDASINRGNSGGALLNLDGALIGINCSMHPSAQGISFTVPADDVQRMLERARVSPRPAEPKVVEPTPAPPPPVVGPVAKSSGRSAQTAPQPARDGALAPLGFAIRKEAQGIRIVSLGADSSADIAGLEVGDVIVEVDDEEVDSAAEVEKALSEGYPGRTYFIGILRGADRKRAILVYPGS
jgi:serine protease Do